MSDTQNNDLSPVAGDDDRTETDELTPHADLPLGVSGILPVGGMLSTGSLMGEGGGYGSPLGGAGLYPIIAPLGEMQDAEQEIAGGVETAFAEDGRLSSAAQSSIHISASLHTIILEGTVPSETERHTAEEIARHVPHVRGVENRLTVSSA